ncbi:hypothetical protein SBDP1_830021 [Syntrophobacter sp. SbD1]|nr:hypothetical protein SBDP1_830021 [Syntrophobacter sp. SbD1]
MRFSKSAGSGERAMKAKVTTKKGYGLRVAMKAKVKSKKAKVKQQQMS